MDDGKILTAVELDSDGTPLDFIETDSRKIFLNPPFSLKKNTHYRIEVYENTIKILEVILHKEMKVENEH